jgi:hypothetical protein
MVPAHVTGGIAFLKVSLSEGELEGGLLFTIWPSVFGRGVGVCHPGDVAEFGAHPVVAVLVLGEGKAEVAIQFPAFGKAEAEGGQQDEDQAEFLHVCQSFRPRCRWR